MTLAQYLETHLLDYKRYEIIGAFKTEESWAIIERSISPEEKLHYCVQHAGNGKYFSNLSSLNEYIHKRWGKE